MVVITLITLYPVWFSVINSLNSASAIAKNGYAMVLTDEFSLASWQAVLKNSEIVKAFFITLARTVLVTAGQTVNGGVISYFLLFTGMKIYNTFWVYIIPSLFGGFYNVIIYNANFREIPASLVESAKLDGASEYSIFFKIFMPLSKPVLSALAIFTAVGTWNDYTQTLYYTRSTDLQTLSYYMLTIIKSSQTAENMSKMGTAASSVLSTMSEQASNYKTIELACMVLSSIPLIVMYPFAQKFFEKGLMVGSVKG